MSVNNSSYNKSIDLDINNYTISELMNFFRLNDGYSSEELDNSEGELINNIFKVNINL